MSGAHDADGDSQMRSSSSGEDETESMFPSADDPQTPRHNPVLSEYQVNELSPPASQDPPAQNGILSQDDPMDYAEVQHVAQSQRHLEQLGPGENLEKNGNAELEPGSSWNNDKAREEYLRALDQVLDQSFNLREFGDPFDEGGSKA
ncbi:hypothetical protein MMC20_004427 [Loxospora ochrophaea]|nr:hypothetical protein [Loxospora ochrophaea]